MNGGINMDVQRDISFSAKPVFHDIRNFLAGRFLGATRDEFLLNELIKIILCKFHMRDENLISDEATELSSIYRKRFNSLVKKYKCLFKDDEEIELDPISISYIHEKLNEIDLFNIERDPIGEAYEIFIGDVIKGQSGQFFTPKNAAQALIKMINPKPGDKLLDLACGAGGFLIAALIHYINSGATEEQIQHALRNNIYGIDKDEYLTNLAKIHIACLTGIVPNIKCADSIEWNKDILGEAENQYDVIVTNPPFGANIKVGSIETLSKYDLAYKWRTSKDSRIIKTNSINESVPPQVVFVEQCIRLVKPNGRIGIVVPESLISSKKYAFVVEYIKEYCIIDAVLGMPEELFKTSGKGGTHTKTCLLVLTKKEDIKKHGEKVFFAEAEWCGHDSRGKEIPKDDIPHIVNNFIDYIKTGSLKNPSQLGYLISFKNIENNILAPRYYTQHIIAQNNTLMETHDLIRIGKLIEEGVLRFDTGNEVGKLAYGTGDIPFIRTSDISNWEIKADPKHCVGIDIYESLKEKQDVREGDILMVKDGTYLIGTCAMITKYDTKMVYQSHLYKIRVNEDNPYQINPYFLLAVLSCDYVQNQIKSRTYSQDIIDSLGDRYKDLLLPIPKDKSKIKRITEMVKKSISDRIEARELARQARVEVIK